MPFSRLTNKSLVDRIVGAAAVPADTYPDSLVFAGEERSWWARGAWGAGEEKQSSSSSKWPESQPEQAVVVAVVDE